MTTNINIRIDSELKNILLGYAKLENKTLSEVVLDAVMAKIENDYDYKLALLASKTVDMNDKTTLEDLCKEAGINYDEI